MNRVQTLDKDAWITNNVNESNYFPHDFPIILGYEELVE